MTYGDYISLQKFIQNGDTTLLEFAVEKLIDTYVDLKGHTLSALEKLIVLTYLRTISKNGELSLSLKENEIARFSLTDFLNQVLVNEDLFKRETLEGNVAAIKWRVEVGPPQQFAFKTVFDYMYSCIHKVSVQNSPDILFKDLSATDQNKMLNRLPASITQQLERYSKQYELAVNQIPLNLPFHLFTGNAEPLILSAKNGVLLELLKVFVGASLTNIQEVNYVLVSKANFTMQDLYMMTPGEVDVAVGLLDAELKDKASQAAAAQGGGPSIASTVG